MESEYFESSWKVKKEWLRRRLRTTFQNMMARYYKSKRKGYTRFLTEEEQRCRTFFVYMHFAICYASIVDHLVYIYICYTSLQSMPINLIIRIKLINLSKMLLDFLSFHLPNSIKNKYKLHIHNIFYDFINLFITLTHL